MPDNVPTPVTQPSAFMPFGHDLDQLFNRMLRAWSFGMLEPATNGLPVAYGVCEALRAHQVYWAARENKNEPQKFAEYLELKPGEKVLLIDDILRTGTKLTELKKLVEAKGGEVVGLAVVIYQPTPATPSFDPLPFYYLAKLDAMYYKDAASCDLCKRGVPVDRVLT